MTKQWVCKHWPSSDNRWCAITQGMRWNSIVDNSSNSKPSRLSRLKILSQKKKCQKDASTSRTERTNSSCLVLRIRSQWSWYHAIMSCSIFKQDYGQCPNLDKDKEEKNIGGERLTLNDNSGTFRLSLRNLFNACWAPLFPITIACAYSERRAETLSTSSGKQNGRAPLRQCITYTEHEFSYERDCNDECSAPLSMSLRGTKPKAIFLKSRLSLRP